MQIQNTQQSSEQHNNIRYVIEGNPIPLARVRFSRQGHCYDSQKQIKFATAIIIRNQHGDRPKYDGPLHLSIVFFMPIPKRSKAIEWHSKRPDLDNLVKMVCDSLIGILYEDDSCIAMITARKVYGDNPRTEFTLTPLLS